MDRINYHVNNYDFSMINIKDPDDSSDKHTNNNDINSNNKENNSNTNTLNNSNEVKTEKKPSVPRLKGLYLYGEVGVGKTLLMDTFYSVCNGIISLLFMFHIIIQIIK